MQNEKALAQDIHAFLKKYGKRDVNEPDEWSSPDACLLEAFARALEGTEKPKRIPFSDWGSGGYAPYTSQEGRDLHDALIVRCQDYVKTHKA